MYKNLVTRRAVSIVALTLTTAPWAATPTSPIPPLKVAFVYVTPVLPVGWTHQHELGRQAIDAAFGDRVRTTHVDNVAEGTDAERVIRELARSGNKLIFTTSFGYMEPTLAVARDFPDVRFESITGYKTAPNVAVANARYYEGRYLAGIATGRASRSGMAGYVAGFPIPEVLQGINAFTLGMRSVNPEAQVRVVWLDAWFDPPRERDAAMTLFNQGVDVIAFHTGSTAVISAAEERGKLAIAYHSDMRGVAPNAQLVAVTHWWGAYYRSRVEAVLDGRWQTGDVWGGLAAGMVRVGDFGPQARPAWQDEVSARAEDIAAGRLQPFAAGRVPVRDSEGHIVIESGQALSDEEIQRMNWLVEGVQGKLSR